MGNILKKAKAEGRFSPVPDFYLQLQEPAEQKLHQALIDISTKAIRLAEDYVTSLQVLAALKVPIDDFFDNVMVNVDDEKLRNSRLTLLAGLHNIMNRIADLSKMAY